MILILCRLLLALFLAILSEAELEQCSSFSINGSESYFEYYRFYDFRNLNPGKPLGGSPPSADIPKSAIVNDTSWIKDWRIRQHDEPASKPNEIVNMRYALSNVFIERGRFFQGSAVTLLTVRENTTSQLGAELGFLQTNITHGSFRVLARVNGGPGMIAGVRVHHDDQHETSIELLTRGPHDTIHLYNQPILDDDGELEEGASFNVSDTGEDFTGWNVYRIDWLPDGTTWYINGKELARTNVNVPTKESMFILNTRSYTGGLFGDMRVGGYGLMQVQWVEMAFNTDKSESTSDLHDGTVCSIDQSIGSPIPTSAASAVYLKAVWAFLGLLLLLILEF